MRGIRVDIFKPTYFERKGFHGRQGLSILGLFNQGTASLNSMSPANFKGLNIATIGPLVSIVSIGIAILIH